MLKSAQQAQRGIGLIEVLISMLILGIGVLGMISVQNRALQFNQGALHESRAAILANDIMDRIRANPTQASRYRIALSESPPSANDCSGSSANCSEPQLADFDLASWRGEISQSLPAGTGEVREIPGPGDSSIFIVTIQYQDSRIEDASAFSQSSSAEQAPKQLVFRTSL